MDVKEPKVSFLAFKELEQRVYALEERCDALEKRAVAAETAAKLIEGLVAKVERFHNQVLGPEFPDPSADEAGS